MQKDPKQKRRTPSKAFVLGLAIFAAGTVFAAAFNTGLEYTNRTEFCTSCHTMQINLKELKETKHWTNLSGVHAGCADCHVPKDFPRKMVAKVMAAKDVFHQIVGTIDTPEKYEARRLEMAQRVWDKMKASGSAECMSCHAFAHMDLSEQDRFARRKHLSATDRGKSCIDCHKGVGHKLPQDAAEEGDDDGSSAAGGDAPANAEAAAGGHPPPADGSAQGGEEQKVGPAEPESQDKQAG